MSCELRPGLSKPIDALIKYFLEVKPYHTKLLEIVEKYRINEYISVGVSESHSIDIIKKNLALCGPVGFGLIWDEECGFDAVECCDLFECIGGYGLIFDNSDLLVTADILNINESADSVELVGEYTSNDFTYDQRIQINSITTSDTVTLAGNYLDIFNTHKMFLVVPYFTMDIVNNTANSFFVAGNKVSELKSKKNFRINASRYNNGVYAVSIVRYIPSLNMTEVVVNETVDTTIVAGYMEVSSPNKNNGVYQVKSVIFDGTNTLITIRNNNVFNHITESVHGSIQIRTGLIASRRVWHFNPDTSEVTEFKITGHSYDPIADTTTLTFAESITTPMSGNGEIRLYGYKFGAGYDGFEECSTPKPFNVNMNIGEVLNITIETIPVTPTPTPSVTPTPTPTPSNSYVASFIEMEDCEIVLMEDGSPALMEDESPIVPCIGPTPTPTVTPSVTGTIAVTPTPTVTPTVTPTETISITPTPTVTPSVTASAGIAFAEESLISGSFTTVAGTGQSYLARIDNSGNYDPAFLPSIDDYPSSMRYDNADRIILSGYFSTYNAASVNNIIRVSSVDGTLDPSFIAYADDAAQVICVLSSGDYLIGGYFTSVNGSTRYSLAKLSAVDGSLDPSFASLVTDNGIQCITELASGKILIGGDFTEVDTSIERPGLARLNSDGTLDATFDAGFLTLETQIYNVYELPDTRLLVVGSFSEVGGFSQSGAVLLNADGSRDLTTSLTGVSGTGYAAVVQTDGKMILLGNFADINGTPSQFLGRILTSGALDVTFNNPLLAGGSYDGIAATFDNTHLLLYGAWEDIDTTGIQYVVRMDNDGNIDTGYDLALDTNLWRVSIPTS